MGRKTGVSPIEKPQADPELGRGAATGGPFATIQNTLCWASGF